MLWSPWSSLACRNHAPQPRTAYPPPRSLACRSRHGVAPACRNHRLAWRAVAAPGQPRCHGRPGAASRPVAAAAQPPRPSSAPCSPAVCRPRRRARGPRPPRTHPVRCICGPCGAGGRQVRPRGRPYQARPYPPRTRWRCCLPRRHVSSPTRPVWPPGSRRPCSARVTRHELRPRPATATQPRPAQPEATKSAQPHPAQ